MSNLISERCNVVVETEKMWVLKPCDKQKGVLSNALKCGKVNDNPRDILYINSIDSCYYAVKRL